MRISERVGIRLIVVIGGLTAALLMTGVQTASAGRSAATAFGDTSGAGHVLPADARPLGYSLRDMTKKVAAFTTHANDPDFYPHTPFQILYTAGVPDSVRTSNGGLTATGTNAFTVRKGTRFYVPLQNADDSPQIIGMWPTSAAGARHYFFDHDQLGGKDYKVILDGKATKLGQDYLSGPVTVAPLGDGGGTHIITLGAFIEGFGKGVHTVRIVGQLAGDLIPPALGGAKFLGIDFIYTVTVTGWPRHGPGRN